MEALPNIEKSSYRHEYVGYANGVWFIKKSNSSYGNWIARYRDDVNISPIFAWTLKSMSVKLKEYANVHPT